MNYTSMVEAKFPKVGDLGSNPIKGISFQNFSGKSDNKSYD